VLTLVITVVSAFAGAVLETFDLGIGIPPQILGLEVGIDDRVRQAVIAVEILGRLRPMPQPSILIFKDQLKELTQYD
jgi:hypothetical protein